MKSTSDAKGVTGTLGLVASELKKRRVPVTIERSIQSALPLLSHGSKRRAILLLWALRDIEKSIDKALRAVKQMEQEIDRDVRRLEAIAQDELLRKEKDAIARDEESRRRNRRVAPRPDAVGFEIGD